MIPTAPPRPHSNSTRSRRWRRCDRLDAVDVAVRESTRRAREARPCRDGHPRPPRRPLDPRHVRRHVTALPGDLRRRLFCMPRARADRPRRDLLHRRDDLRQRPGRRRRRRDRGLRGHGLRWFGDRHRGPARSVGRLYNRTTPAPVRRPGPRRGPGPGLAGADPDLGVGHLPARGPRGRLRAPRGRARQRPPGHFWYVAASFSLLSHAIAPTPSTTRLDTQAARPATTTV